MTILDDIIAYKKDEVSLAKNNAPLGAIEKLANDAGPVRGFVKNLQKRSANSFAIIAEIKKASPSKGLIREDFMPEDHARSYEAGGAACLSVLTDNPSFQGDGKFLRVARAACSLPVLRKDFMIDPYQCVEARAWGADCILLIMSCLSDAQAYELEQAAREFDLDVLVEVHNEKELERALDLATPLIGVNNRDLNSFDTNLSTTAKLAQLCPNDRFLVSESGIATNQDLHTLQGYGAKAFLVGESLMRKTNIEEATRTLLSGTTHTA